jgi:hypothetical protein
MNCYSPDCNRPVDFNTAYGCINLHTWYGKLCATHTTVFRKRIKEQQYLCLCGEPYIDMLTQLIPNHERHAPYPIRGLTGNVVI